MIVNQLDVNTGSLARLIPFSKPAAAARARPEYWPTKKKKPKKCEQHNHERGDT
jgi:hypothetical protein